MKKLIVFALALALVATPVLAAAPDGSGPWADSVISSSQGLKKNGTAVAADRSDATDALGVAESNGDDYDSPVIAGSFFSLGFGGSVILSFDNAVVNGDGDDLQLFEVTGGSSYPDELVDVEVSHNGVDWYLAAQSVTRDATIDIGFLGCISQVRITDVSNPADFNGDADGYDLDGVKALHTDPETCNLAASINIEKTASSTEILAGETADYTYLVTNTGDLPLDNVVVEDDKCSPVSYISGDTGDDGVLESGEAWVFGCSQILAETTVNIGTVTADDPFDNEVSGSDELEVVVIKDLGCTLTQGYWKNHSKYSKHEDETWDGMEDNSFYLSGQSYLEVLNTAPKGNAYYQLAHQFIAAMLNIDAGADDSVVESAIDDSIDFFGNHFPYELAGKGKNADKVLDAQALELAGVLGSYNEGLIGPGHCE